MNLQPRIHPKLLFVLALALSTSAHAAVDGFVINGTTQKPQAGSTVTLFQTTQQGPQNLGSVKTDASGKFVFTQDVKAGEGGGPLLLQAVFDGVQYNKTLPPGFPTLGVNIPVFQSLKTPGEAKIEQHFFVLEPAPDGTMTVNEGFVYKNDGKTTWNNPDTGTLQFEIPAAANGKVEVNVLAPGGLPIRRAPDPLGKPNQFKVDFPIKPGESRVDLSWSMPFKSPGVFSDHILSKAGVLRVVAPLGVEFKSDDVSALGQEPTSKATIYAVKGPDVRFQVTGTGLFSQEEQSSSNNGQSLSENLPKLYGLLTANSSFLQSVSAVKWILATVLGMLALGFTLLYRKGDPNNNERGRG
ncbi:MAG TPA: hypothetical protein VHZ74_20525 [Bryobacteraceae bacterium]|jgi:hypothetical protein|nr:hypothetical protein [Bryobacteraceae bacterium]